jgi:hypothetical protein
MKFVTLTALALLSAGPAFAWTAQTGGSGPQAIGQDSGSATAQAQHQGQHQTATGGAGGNGYGGSARASGGRATGGTSNASVSVSGIGGSNSGGGGGRAPDVFVPSVGGGGGDCPVVGFGVGGAGIGGGGGFGPTWISSDCNRRRVADLLSHLYGPAVARAYAEQQIEGVKEAVAAASQGRPQYKFPAWCIASNGMWLADLPECGEDKR